LSFTLQNLQKKKKKNKMCFFDKLSEELLLLIFSYINDVNDIVNLSLVSKTFYRISFDDLLWRQLAMKYFPKNLDELVCQSSDGYSLPSDFIGFRRFFARCYSCCRDFRSGRQRATVLEGHSDAVNCFQVLDIHHSLHVVSGGKDGY
jgi:hypothetical protein